MNLLWGDRNFFWFALIEWNLFHVRFTSVKAKKTDFESSLPGGWDRVSGDRPTFLSTKCYHKSCTLWFKFIPKKWIFEVAWLSVGTGIRLRWQSNIFGLLLSSTKCCHKYYLCTIHVLSSTYCCHKSFLYTPFHYVTHIFLHYQLKMHSIDHSNFFNT